MADEALRSERLDRSVLEAIAERPPVHVVDLADRLDEHPVAVDRACARLHGNGHVRPADGGRYTPTDEGRQRLGESPE